MTVTLNIANDAELRNYIKDMIKGQVLAVTREEIIETTKNELNRKIEGMSSYQWERYFKDSLTRAVYKILEEQGVALYKNELVEPIVEVRVNELLKTLDINKLVEKVTVDKIKSILQ